MSSSTSELVQLVGKEKDCLPPLVPFPPFFSISAQSLYGAKVQAHAAHLDYLEIKLEKESEVRSL